ncbi:regulatory protein LuxR [Arthrobacter crystallopoietes BAB-32]|uniref:Regulatory protein LuxR n=1 Tax=Arthrobacter crystallopoietes BAB-32 TaxID=1246476 RepID=N1UTU1_9MICC|nr:LuxR family transcriptional regulator [Arthrobacter crystallopoietes]EMY33816.1 regulatory protein LuxR [Arthrobacter crystallopoietes BAB-32]
MASAMEQLLIDGRNALDSGDWMSARQHFTLALKSQPGPEAAYGLARAVEWAGDFAAAIGLYEKAFVLYRRRGEVRLPALIAARELSFLYGAVCGNSAAANGWMARGETLADAAGDCVETGWVHLAACLASGDLQAMRSHAAVASELGRRLGNQDLELCARSYTGLALVLGGRISAGMRLIDEAAAGALAGEVRDYQAAGEIFCKMLLCSELTLDVQRARQWMDVAAGFGRSEHAAWVPAVCGMHYGGILIAAGEWPEAERRLVTAIADYDGGFRALRAGAVVRLADLRLRQGRLGEAAVLLEGSDTDAAAARPLAQLRLANGDASGAASLLRQQLAASGGSLLTAPETAVLAEVYLALGDRERAAGLACEMGVLAAATGLVQYRALADFTLGLCAAARGDAAAIPHLEAASAEFKAAGLPLEHVRSRLALARALIAVEPPSAAAEAFAALHDSERLGAARDADAAALLLRQLGHHSRSAPRPGGPLTRREEEVLRLIAEGLSNSQIAARLFISKRTVEHHVGSILAKLGLATRAEAQAHASPKMPLV